MNGLRITEAAREWLVANGGMLTLRVATRHGCCGGSAGVPVAEARMPDDPAALEQSDEAGLCIWRERGLADVALLVDIDGFGRWKRLIVEGPVQALRSTQET
jgi:hypothetical protein